MRLLGLAILLGCALLIIPEAGCRASHASEVHVDQAHGRLPAGAATIGTKTEKKPKGLNTPNALTGAPEGVPPTVTMGSPTTPATCNQQNASSPACYTSTQQARPAGK